MLIIGEQTFAHQKNMANILTAGDLDNKLNQCTTRQCRPGLYRMFRVKMG